MSSSIGWKTGRIVNGSIHNPHFYQARRLLNGNVRNPGDNVCGGVVNDIRYYNYSRNIKYSFSQLKQVFQIKNPNLNLEDLNLDKLYKLILEILSKLHRATIHNNHILTNLRDTVLNLSNNDELRINFMLNRITEAQFKKSIMMKNKKPDKNRLLLEVFEMYNTIITETINSLFEDIYTTNKTDIINKILKNQDKIIDITRELQKLVNILILNFSK